MDADGCRWVRKGTTVQADKQTRQACTYIGTQHMLFGLMAGKFPHIHVVQASSCAGGCIGVIMYADGCGWTHGQGGKQK